MKRDHSHIEKLHAALILVTDNRKPTEHDYKKAFELLDLSQKVSEMGLIEEYKGVYVRNRPVNHKYCG